MVATFIKLAATSAELPPLTVHHKNHPHTYRHPCAGHDPCLIQQDTEPIRDTTPSRHTHKDGEIERAYGVQHTHTHSHRGQSHTHRKNAGVERRQGARGPRWYNPGQARPRPHAGQERNNVPESPQVSTRSRAIVAGKLHAMMAHRKSKLVIENISLRPTRIQSCIMDWESNMGK